MAIEFHCSQCRSLLRTPDDTAGKQAKCPECGALTTIPSQGQGGEAPTVGEFATGPRPDAAAESYPVAEPAPVNPYQTPGSPQLAGPTREELKSKVMGPAIGMIVCAVLTILYMATNLILIASVGLESLGVELGGPPGPGPRPDQTIIFHAIFGYTLLVIAIAIGVIIGAVALLRMRSYGIAMIGSILALLPCMPCCVVNIPFGLWAVIVLSDIHVRSTFQ